MTYGLGRTTKAAGRKLARKSTLVVVSRPSVSASGKSLWEDRGAVDLGGPVAGAFDPSFPIWQ
jgi:hypothetical protein